MTSSAPSNRQKQCCGAFKPLEALLPDLTKLHMHCILSLPGAIAVARLTSAFIRALLLGDFQKRYGGAKRDRTADLYNAIVALSQLSYSP